MTKKNFFHYYNELSGADDTLIFFIHKHMVYLYKCHHIAPRWTKEARESKSKGGYQKFRMYISATEKAKLIAKGAIPIMTEVEFNALPYARNKGHRCEYWLHMVCDLGEYTPDKVPFDVCGDIRIDGIEYQIKFQNASLTNVNALHNAQARARARRRAVV